MPQWSLCSNAVKRCVYNLKITEGMPCVSLRNTGATSFLSVSHLVQMDTRVNGSFGLVALKVGVHSLFTHANSGKHLTDVLQHKGGKQ